MDVARVVITCFAEVAAVTAARKSGSRMVSDYRSVQNACAAGQGDSWVRWPTARGRRHLCDDGVLHAVEKGFELALAGAEWRQSCARHGRQFCQWWRPRCRFRPQICLLLVRAGRLARCGQRTSAIRAQAAIGPSRDCGSDQGGRITERQQWKPIAIGGHCAGMVSISERG